MLLTEKMRFYLLSTVIYGFSALAVAVPRPQSVTKVAIQTQSVSNRQATDPSAASITAPPTAANSLDPAAVSLASILSLFIAPSSFIAQLTNIPASIISIFEGPDAFAEYQAIANAPDGADPDQLWINSLTPSQWSWIVSQASVANSFVPQITSLWFLEVSNELATLSASASLLSQTLTATFEGFGAGYGFTTTAYPAATHISPPQKSGISISTLEGLGFGIPIGVWIVIVFIMLFYCGGLETFGNRSQRRAGGFHDSLDAQGVGSQNPVLPFPDHGERDFGTETTLVNGGGNEAIELVEFKDENWASSTGNSVKTFPATNETGEQLYQPSALNDVSDTEAPQVSKHEATKNFSSRQVVSMEHVPTPEQMGTNPGVDSDDSKNEDRGCVDATEMSAEPAVGRHTLQGFPHCQNQAEKVRIAN